jgi:hypothetical protein
MALESGFFDLSLCQLDVHARYPKHGRWVLYDDSPRSRRPRVQCHFGSWGDMNQGF